MDDHGCVCVYVASWDLDSGSKGAKEEYHKARIRGTTAFFDIDEIADKSSPYDHMLPSPEVFQDAVGKVKYRQIAKLSGKGSLLPLSCSLE